MSQSIQLTLCREVFEVHVNSILSGKTLTKTLQGYMQQTFHILPGQDNIVCNNSLTNITEKKKKRAGKDQLLSQNGDSSHDKCTKTAWNFSEIFLIFST